MRMKRTIHTRRQELSSSFIITRSKPCFGTIPVRRFTLIMAMLATSMATHAADGTLSLSTGLDYSVGDYGDTQDTETWFFPLNLKYRSGRYTFKLGTSHIWVKGPQSVTPEGDPLPGGGMRRVVDGSGDITTSLIASVLKEDDATFDLDLAGKIKFGTADASKALGTGENDYSLQASLYKTLGSWGPYLDLGYRWKGDPIGVNYRNVWFGTMGASYRLNRSWSIGADYSWRDKQTATSSQMSEATVYANYKIDEHNKLNVYGVTGFSDASPDWGIGMTAAHTF